MTFITANIRLWGELLVLCRRQNRVLFSISMATLVLSSLATALTGVGVRAIVDGSQRGSVTAVVVGGAGAALGYAIIQVATEAGTTLRILLGTAVAYEDVEYRTWRATMDTEGIEHLERPDFVSHLRELHTNPGSYPVVASVWNSLDAFSTLVRLGLVFLLLGTVNPLLLVAPAVAVVPLVLGQLGRAAVRRARQESADQFRLQRHYFELATDAATAKEIRLSGSGDEVIRRLRAAADRDLAHQARAQFRAVLWEGAGWTLFTLAFVAGLAVSAHDAAGNGARVGDIVLTVVVGLQLRSIIQTAAAQAAAVGTNGSALAAYHWLQDYRRTQRSLTAGATRPAPEQLTGAVVFEDVAFGYSAGGRSAVSGLSLRLPAGSVCALVGDYGSGKTTIVKLLLKLYRPDSGRITVDGVDLAVIDASSWRERSSAAFQDFGRYQTSMAENIRIGDLEGGDDLTDAVEAAAATDLVAALPQGLDTALGTRFGGLDLSQGQWQKLALARASRRRSPLLLILDEPTASLDAPSEHAVFERYMARARETAQQSGGITLIVTHRYSTVAGADQILCVQDGRIAESGTHDELLAQGGRYAQLYRLQADGYAPESRAVPPPADRDGAAVTALRAEQ